MLDKKRKKKDTDFKVIFIYNLHLKKKKTITFLLQGLTYLAALPSAAQGPPSIPRAQSWLG